MKALRDVDFDIIVSLDHSPAMVGGTYTQTAYGVAYMNALARATGRRDSDGFALAGESARQPSPPGSRPNGGANEPQCRPCTAIGTLSLNGGSQMRHRTALHLPAVSLTYAVALTLWLWSFGAQAGSQTSAATVFSLRSVPDGLNVYVARAGQPDTIFNQANFKGRTPLTLPVEAGEYQLGYLATKALAPAQLGAIVGNPARRSSGFSLSRRGAHPVPGQGDRACQRQP